jgi:hypothetical protein
LQIFSFLTGTGSGPFLSFSVIEHPGGADIRFFYKDSFVPRRADVRFFYKDLFGLGRADVRFS